ncbi:hypothetical protein FQZ97_843590 [compost metagenome]
MLVGEIATRKSHVRIDQVLRSLSPTATEFRLVEQQDLALGHSPDAGETSVSGGDEAGVDVRPARAFSTARSAMTRSTTSPTKKGPVTVHHT